LDMNFQKSKFYMKTFGNLYYAGRQLLPPTKAYAMHTSI